MNVTIREKDSGGVLAQGAHPDDVIKYEGNWYFRPEAVARGALRVTERTYTCPHKGVCFWVDYAGPDGRSQHPGDVAGQARAVFGIIERALAEGRFSLRDVVRTRMFVVDMADSAALSAVHGEVFGAIRPASTMVAVAGLIDPTLLVEIEAEARRS